MSEPVAHGERGTRVRYQRLPVVVDVRSIVRVNHLNHPAPQQVLGRVAEQAFDRWADVHHAAVAFVQGDHVGAVLDQRAETLLTPSQHFLRSALLLQLTSDDLELRALQHGRRLVRHDAHQEEVVTTRKVGLITAGGDCPQLAEHPADGYHGHSRGCTVDRTRHDTDPGVFVYLERRSKRAADASCALSTGHSLSGTGCLDGAVGVRGR